MVSPFSFKGKIGRLPYMLWSLAAFFSQHLVALSMFEGHGISPKPESWLNGDWWFYVTPLRLRVTDRMPSAILLLLALAYLLMVAWALAALTFRRAASADFSEWTAAAAMAPIVQVPVILVLWVIPPRTPPDLIRENVERAVPRWSAAAQGSIVGIGLTLASVAVGALIFGTCGYGMFVVSPFIVGAAAAYFGNRKQDIGAGRTMALVAGAVVLSGIALVGAALEGVVCLILAAPLGLGFAWIGGFLAAQLRSKRAAHRARRSRPWQCCH